MLPIIGVSKWRGKQQKALPATFPTDFYSYITIDFKKIRNMVT